MTSKSHITKKDEQKPKWFLVDAKGMVLGRIATRISRILMGKNKTNYVPYLDMGDNVIVTNAKKVVLTGNKEEGKVYSSHSGYPGGFKEATVKELRAKKPEEILRKAIKGMMPKTRMGRAMIKKLHIYADDQHPYQNKELKTLS